MEKIMSNVRKNTIKVLEMMEDGVLTWEVWARETLAYLSEYQVSEIAHTLELFEDEEEDQDDEE
jgi:hypothetical protein